MSAVLNEQKTLVDYARQYIKAGWAVLPLHSIANGQCTCGKKDCKAPGKHPRMVLPYFEKGVLDATTDLEAFAEAVDLFPHSNLGIRPPADVMVLDIDPRNGGDEELDELQGRHGRLPDTAEQISGSGGRHILLKVPNGARPKGKPGNGIDIKTSTGFIVAEPSMHASGRRYGWEASSSLLEGVRIARAPDWLLSPSRAATEASTSIQLRELAPLEMTRLRSALAAIPSDDRDQWIKFAHALAAVKGGRELWMEWSQTSKKFDPADAERTWRSLKPKGEVSYQTIFKLASDLGWKGPESANEPTVKPAAAALEYVLVDEIGEAHDPLEIVEGVLTAGALSVIYGDSNVGKTFAALDMACSVARGAKWMGRDVEPGLVLYLACEGKGGIHNRLKGYMLKHQCRLADQLAIVYRPVNFLSNGDDAQATIEAVRELERRLGKPVRLIVGDTLSAMMPGADQNGSESMTAVTGNAQHVIHETGAHFLLIHHSGKDPSKGARGSSTLRAAIDTELEVREDGSVRVIEVTKQRDLPTKGEKIHFALQAIQVGSTRKGKPITTCVVEPAEQPAATVRMSESMRQAMDLLGDVVSTGAVEIDLGPALRMRGARVEDWRKAYVSVHGLSNRDAARTQFNRALKSLCEAGVIVHNAEAGVAYVGTRVE